MSAYSKNIAEGTFEHKFYESLGFPPISDEDDRSLVLRVTLGNMELMDGFYMPLPVEAVDCSIEDAIQKFVICEDEEDRILIKRKLAREPNPDLLDVYDGLLWLYEQADGEEVILSYHINNGADEIPPTDSVNLHQQACVTDDGRSYSLLDLVLEVYDNIDPFSGMSPEQKETMLRDFRGLLLLYFMDKFDYQPELDGVEQDILDRLASEDIALIRFEESYFITHKGQDFLSNIIDEAEFYIDNYDIFGDVYIQKSGEITFGMEYGENLIVPVFMREGIDPYRAFFIAALYLGNLDHLISDPNSIFSEEPFKMLFSLIVHSPAVEDIGAELLDKIIQAGKSRIEEAQLKEQRLQHIKSIDRRIESNE